MEQEPGVERVYNTSDAFADLDKIIHVPPEELPQSQSELFSFAQKIDTPIATIVDALLEELPKDAPNQAPEYPHGQVMEGRRKERLVTIPHSSKGYHLKIAHSEELYHNSPGSDEAMIEISPQWSIRMGTDEGDPLFSVERNARESTPHGYVQHETFFLRTVEETAMERQEEDFPESEPVDRGTYGIHERYGPTGRGIDGYYGHEAQDPGVITLLRQPENYDNDLDPENYIYCASQTQGVLLLLRDAAHRLLER